MAKAKTQNAKTQSSSIAQHEARMSALADAVVASVAPLQQARASYTASKEALQSAGGGTWGALVALVKEAATLAECYDWLGNGESGKARTAGKLAGKLGTENADSVKSLLSDARRVAVARFNLGYTIPDDKGKNAIKAEIAKLEKGPAASEPGPVEIKAGDGDIIGQFIAKHGMAAVLRKAAEILKAERKSATDAGALNAIAEHYKTA